MPICRQLKTELDAIRALATEFDAAFDHVKETGDMAEAKALKARIEEKMASLKETLWPFGSLSKKEMQEQYESQMALCRERGLLQTLSGKQEGIKDERGNEYLPPAFEEVLAALKTEAVYRETIETFEKPLVLITPFALPPQTMVDAYGKQIGEHFVEKTTKGDRRIPDRNKTRLLGVDREPLELRVDGRNVFFSDSLENPTYYFPQWNKDAERVKATGGMTKQEAITRLNGWAITIVEDISLAPEKGQGKTKRKEITIKGAAKTIERKQVEGGLDVAQQYALLQQHNEEGLTPEEYIFFAMLHLRQSNSVLDDDRETAYYCRLLGVATASGAVPYAYWNRDYRQAFLGGYDLGGRGGYYGVRSGVRVHPVKKA